MAIVDSQLDLIRTLIRSPEASDKIISYLKESLLRINEIKELRFNKTQLTDDIYALEQAFESVTIQETFFEAHQKHVDIQFMLDGFEVFGIANKSNLIVKVEYDPSRDVGFYNIPKNFSEIKLLSGWFAIYFPWDSHLCRWKKDDKYYSGIKTVVKVPLSYFNIA